MPNLAIFRYTAGPEKSNFIGEIAVSVFPNTYNRTETTDQKGKRTVCLFVSPTI